jgi:hypothetical protein
MGRLGGGVQGEMPGPIEIGDAPVGLQEGAILALVDELICSDEVTFLECRLHIPELLVYF